MENFITGYPGQEHQHRAAMLRVLGREKKYEYFFNKFLTYFFTEEDAKFFASLGLNCLRIPFNYRHFEDNMNPKVLKTEGFKHLDRVINLRAFIRFWIYMLCLGGQKPDWHSDNTTNYAAFWDHKDFQDRVVWLWEQLAESYKGNVWVAEHTRLPAFYERVEKAIPKIDPYHILYLDGNTFAVDFKYFDKLLPNCTMGFPNGERYKGTPAQKQKLEAAFLRKFAWMREHKVPTWNGEFGPVYEHEDDSEDGAAGINKERFEVLGEQLRIYEKYKVGPWVKTLRPFLEKKKALQADAWGYHPSDEVDGLFLPIIDWISKNSPTAKNKYPDAWNVRRHLSRTFASYFRDMTESQLDDMAKNFALSVGCKREGLNNILRDHARRGSQL
ncbi:putative glucanase [Tirmania nivea]|nr:putative glucanase [Tirmania nivea]